MSVHYAMLLDSGAAVPIGSVSRAIALGRCGKWQAARRLALIERSLVVPRRVVALIRIAPKPLPHRMAVLAARHRHKPRRRKA